MTGVDGIELGYYKYKYNECPKCPYCDKDIDIDDNKLWVLYKEERHDITCPECDREIIVESDAKWTFTTEKDEDDE